MTSELQGKSTIFNFLYFVFYTFSIFNNPQEGLDCGDDVGKFIEEYLGTGENRQLRLLYFTPFLAVKRDLKSDDSYWNNPVPEVEDTVSLFVLNCKLEFIIIIVANVPRSRCFYVYE